jgi:hypothetical protein
MVHNSSPRVLRQACRAMGNMCFESQTGRDIVLSEGGINALVCRLSEVSSAIAVLFFDVVCHWLHGFKLAIGG